MTLTQKEIQEFLSSLSKEDLSSVIQFAAEQKMTMNVACEALRAARDLFFAEANEPQVAEQPLVHPTDARPKCVATTYAGTRCLNSADRPGGVCGTHRLSTSQAHRLPPHSGEVEASVKMFYEGCFIKGDQQFRALDVYDAYSGWCRGTGRLPVSLKRFGIDMTLLGVKKDHSSNRTKYVGLTVKPDAKPNGNSHSVN